MPASERQRPLAAKGAPELSLRDGQLGHPCCLMSICPRRYSLPQMPDARVSWFVAAFADACLGGALRLGPALVTVKVTSSVMRA
jgi:hypothetical protein